MCAHLAICGYSQINNICELNSLILVLYLYIKRLARYQLFLYILFLKTVTIILNPYQQQISKLP